MVLAAFSPWADVNGPIPLDLLGVDSKLGGQEVSGIDTPAWPVLLGIGAVIVAATFITKLMKLVMLLGFLLVLGGAGLVYYVQNAVEIETRDNELKQLVAERVVDTSTKIGPYMLLGSGAMILVGAAAALRSD